MPKLESCQSRDWVSDSHAFAVAWGVPGIIFMIGIFQDPFTRTMMWSGALLWQGIACVANATRCGRTHCYFTGPFFLIMALMTMLHGSHILGFGTNGWVWLGLVIIAGSGALWFFTERVWGKFLSAKCGSTESIPGQYTISERRL